MVEQIKRLLHLPDVPRYNIKAVVQQTDVNISTLRAWEQRYGLPNPRRSDHGHRLYSERDIAIVKWLRESTESGLAISQAVATLRDYDAADTIQTVETAPSMQQSNWYDLRGQLLDAMSDFNLRQAHLLVNIACTLYPIETVVLELFEPVLIEIGARWARGTVCVAEERLATNFVRQRLLGLIQLHAPFTNGPRMVCMCPPEEQHEIGLLMFALLMEQRGWEVIYLGQSVAMNGLAEFLQRLAPALVCLSASLVEHVGSLKEIGNFIMQTDERLMMVYGGRVFQTYPELQERLPGRYLSSILREAVEEADALGEQIDREAWLSINSVRFRTNGIAQLAFGSPRSAHG